MKVFVLWKAYLLSFKFINLIENFLVIMIENIIFKYVGLPNNKLKMSL